MKILQINATYRIGSTGKIISDLNDILTQNGHEGYMLCAYALETKDNLYIMDNMRYPFNAKLNILKMRITGLNGYSKKKETIKALEWIDSIEPDVIHLHNIHGDWINLEYLFEYIKRKNARVIWTLHDCWAFTGRCSHFENYGCIKWKHECDACRNSNVYPITYFFDKSKKMFRDKKRWFSKIQNMELITPSEWLAELVSNSMLKEYPVTIIPNGVDTAVFFPREEGSKYLEGLERKRLILGVANCWTEGKGLRKFIELDKIIDHEEFQIILVGLSKKQVKDIPKTIIPILRTNNQVELAKIYSQVDCYLNCSILETMGMTTVEAMACGMPVIVFDKTAIPETVGNGCGIILDSDCTIEEIYSAVKDICSTRWERKDKCISHVMCNFDKEKQYKKYLKLYTKDK